ncbi:MAG: primosomal replication protein N [Burkholderiaceae bacterium]|nr:primosomal replication protein N [Burkholderiaceae bacterium]
MNRFQLVASIAERDALRYTPAGVPIVSAKLLHNSKQVEAEIERLVEFEISAIASGEIAGRFNQTELGTTCQFTGFLARKNRNSKSLVFHIIDFSHFELNTIPGA